MNKRVIHKLYWNYEKEEQWLNRMAAKGWNFIDYSLARYLFEEGTPGEYIYRIELLPNLPGHPESAAYIEFMKSVGVEYMGEWVRWVFFRKKASEGSFELFSDYDSKIRHYKRVAAFVGIFAVLNLSTFTTNMMNHSLTGEIFRHPFMFSTFVIALNCVLAIGLSWLAINFILKIFKLRKAKRLYQ